MDKITFKNNELSPNLKNLGNAFSANVNEEGQVGLCYKLYKEDEKYSGSSPLRITIYDVGFRVTGNLRKWWFGKNQAMQDFNYKTFRSCINLLARRLEIRMRDLGESKITYLEIGGSVRLDRKYEYIIPSMINYPRLTRISYTNETTYFKGSKYKIIAYDKTKEVLKNSKFKDKICKSIFIMRFEIKFNNLIGSPIGKRIKTLFDVIFNWGYLQNYWAECYSKIENSKIYNPELRCKNKFLTRTELKDFGIAVTAHYTEPDFLFDIINKNCRPNHKSSERKHIREICKKYEFTDDGDYAQKVLDAVKEKAFKMKMFSNDC